MYMVFQSLMLLQTKHPLSTKKVCQGQIFVWFQKLKAAKLVSNHKWTILFWFKSIQKGVLTLWEF